VRCDDRQWTYGEVDEVSDRVAAGLVRLGVKRGDRVGLLFANCPEMVFCYYACFKLGVVAVPLNIRFQTPELVYALAHSECVALIGQSDLCAPLLDQRAQLPNLAAIFVTGERRPGSIGKPFGDVRLRLVDVDGRDVAPGRVGEVVASSGALTLGYWKDAANTQDVLRDGGIHTGDLAWCDDDGFYWFLGRSKDLIIRYGSNISPGEVEDALYSHPAVYEAAVVGVRDPECGERVQAYVALNPGAHATEADLIEWAGQRIAAYKVPERIVFEAVLPKGVTGKVLRKALRERAAVPAPPPL
jgi:acyl-CoA synthetase (AMP-forming)/AMP-acid ligase II